MADEDPIRRRLNRRRMLKEIGGGGAIGVAGCTENGDDEDDEDGAAADTSRDDGAGEDSDSGGQEGRLKVAQVKGPVEFDPITLNDMASARVADRIFEGLYTYDESTGLVADLATGEPEVTDEGDQYTVEIGEEATFQNGDPVTAEDVRYSFLAPVEEETENANEVNMIESIETEGDRTVTFNLEYPFAAFPNTLTRAIVPKAVREEDKAAFAQSGPVGSGPFEFVEWQEGNYVELERWDGYWGEPAPNLQSIRMELVEEATTRMTALQQGENDVIEGIPPKRYLTIESQDDAGIQEAPGVGYFYLAFNCRSGPTTDPAVREAIDYCFDMDATVENYVEPTGVRQYSPLPEAVAEDWDMPVDEWQEIPHDKDVGQAQQLFEEAGVDQDYRWNIIVPPDDKREQIGVTVGNGLQEAGFDDVEVQRLDWSAFLDKYVTGDEDDYNMYTLGWAGTPNPGSFTYYNMYARGWAGTPDPDSFTYYTFGRTEDILGVTNGTFYGDNSESGKEVADKFVRARETNDREERKQLYEEGITTLLEDRAHLPAYNLKNSFGVKDYLEDFHAHPVSSFTLVTDYNNVSVGNR